MGQNIDFMISENTSSMHVVFLNRSQREALINGANEAEQFLRAISSLGDGVQVCVVDVWESGLCKDIGKIKLIDFQTAISLI